MVGVGADAARGEDEPAVVLDEVVQPVLDERVVVRHHLDAGDVAAGLLDLRGERRPDLVGAERREAEVDTMRMAVRTSGRRLERRARSGSEDQVAVAELVPEVARGRAPRRSERAQQRRAGDRLEQLQVGGLGLVPAGDQPVDGAQRRARA